MAITDLLMYCITNKGVELSLSNSFFVPNELDKIGLVILVYII